MHTQMNLDDVQTVLWVGPRQHAEFCDALGQCESRAAQIALRSSIDNALRRPATDVDLIVVAKNDRSPESNDQITQLCKLVDCQNVILLCGSLMRPYKANSVLQPLSWHQWNQRFPANSSSNIGPKNPSVAIVSSNYATADALMGIACDGGATAVWLRRYPTSTARNLDVVWWDDSVALTNSWEKRIRSFQRTDHRSVRHVWITGGIQFHERESAIASGVDLVISKPFNITALESSLNLSLPTETLQQLPAIMRAA